MNLSDLIAVPATREYQAYESRAETPGKRNQYGVIKAPDVADRRVIAWDMEGMNLSGDDRPQHPVIWGCSADVDGVLVSQKLRTLQMLKYIIEIGKQHPYAIHVGYGFRYDGNMLVQDLAEGQILRLYRDGVLKFKHATGEWRIKWLPGKIFQVTLRWGSAQKAKTTVTIYDYSSFFGGSAFIVAAEKLLGDSMTAAEKETVANGKKERGSNTWENLAEVLHYWSAEIQLMERVFEKFRDVMCAAGFPLKEWYGPGALANSIIAMYGMRPHMAGAQVTSGLMPNAVHEASKRAFFGGRFELFKAGRTVGPIYVYDIGSAYPFALTKIPSLAEDAGEWVHDSRPAAIKRFGFYRITYRSPNPRVNETRPMPLPWRDSRGMITFPASVTGWYASPEAQMLIGQPGARIEEGWYWESTTDERPWEFLQEMYDKRIALGKANLMSMPFKLGPNSIYGKLAQTVGWNEEKNLPPRSHALPIAAWITSYCRAMLYTAMRQHPNEIIAVETDSVITTVSPERMKMKLGAALGEWDVKQYEEIMYLQSGLYHSKHNGEWTGVHSRGLNAREYPVETAMQYLQSCKPGEEWEPLKLTTKPRFIGAGAAKAASGEFKDNHCVWREQTREIKIGGTGKRRHVPSMCEACQEGYTPWDAPHALIVISKSDGIQLSAPRRLPWEQSHTEEVAELRDKLETESDQTCSK